MSNFVDLFGGSNGPTSAEGWLICKIFAEPFVLKLVYMLTFMLLVFE